MLGIDEYMPSLGPNYLLTSFQKKKKLFVDFVMWPAAVNT